MLIALDMAHNVGWAKRGSDGLITFGTRIFSSYSNQPIMAGRKFRGWLNDLLDEETPEALITERPFFRGAAPSLLLFGMSWEAQRSAEARNIPHYDYAPSTIKKFLTGDGYAKKPAMVKAARDRGHNVHNDHEADAVAALLLHEAEMAKAIDENPPRLL